jgi:glycosyltransferase involved in cell wall biosynthesis
MQGAPAERMKIIPNGVDFKTLTALPRPAADDPLTVALVGRVVPIKDIKTFIHAVAPLQAEFPDLKVLIMGPTDEQPDYYSECRSLVAALGLADRIQFSGQVDIREYFPRIHVNVLTSVSESQPLSVLEAGAAAIPTVATDVGACREILFGRSDEHPALGAGGIITDVASPQQTAAGIRELLRDPERRQRLGSVMQQRVKRYYDLPVVDAAYARIYRSHIEASARQVA